MILYQFFYLLQHLLHRINQENKASISKVYSPIYIGSKVKERDSPYSSFHLQFHFLYDKLLLSIWTIFFDLNLVN